MAILPPPRGKNFTSTIPLHPNATELPQADIMAQADIISQGHWSPLVYLACSLQPLSPEQSNTQTQVYHTLLLKILWLPQAGLDPRY